MKWMKVGTQEGVHFYFDRLEPSSKLLTDHNAFEVTLSLCKNITHSLLKTRF